MVDFGIVAGSHHISKSADVSEQAKNYNEAFGKVQNELTVFDNIRKADNHTGDNITPESIDKSYKELDAVLKAKGVTLVNKSKEKMGKATITLYEYSDGTKVWHKPGQQLLYSSPDLGNNFTAGASMETFNQSNGGQLDRLSMSLSDGARGPNNKILDTQYLFNSSFYEGHTDYGETIIQYHSGQDVSVEGLSHLTRLDHR